MELREALQMGDDAVRLLARNGRDEQVRAAARKELGRRGAAEGRLNAARLDADKWGVFEVGESEPVRTFATASAARSYLRSLDHGYCEYEVREVRS